LKSCVLVLTVKLHATKIKGLNMFLVPQV